MQVLISSNFVFSLPRFLIRADDVTRRLSLDVHGHGGVVSLFRRRRPVEHQREEEASAGDELDDDARPEDSLCEELCVVDPSRAAPVTLLLPHQARRVEDDAEHDRTRHVTCRDTYRHLNIRMVICYNHTGNAMAS